MTLLHRLWDWSARYISVVSHEQNLISINVQVMHFLFVVFGRKYMISIYSIDGNVVQCKGDDFLMIEVTFYLTIFQDVQLKKRVRTIKKYKIVINKIDALIFQ